MALALAAPRSRANRAGNTAALRSPIVTESPPIRRRFARDSAAIRLQFGRDSAAIRPRFGRDAAAIRRRIGRPRCGADSAPRHARRAIAAAAPAPQNLTIVFRHARERHGIEVNSLKPKRICAAVADRAGGRITGLFFDLP
ncbi:hypothetical protein [Burkholderia pseudomallei]|uniref:hypothetical protein n=1 Tax=Burkholderia pseudomallei TaxID=28450 RepID=UPI0012AEBBC4|nr:hypothetical protein [Burkholderia pseudomallei]